MEKKAVSLDLDGPLIKRLPIQAEAAFKRALYGINIYNPPPEIPEVNRLISDQPLSLLERISLIVQSHRCLVPEAVDFLREVDGQFDVYGNTGRPNKRLWVKITERTLDKDGILCLLKKIFFTPRGTSSLLSKGAAIRELKRGYEVTHVDDNPATVLSLARVFPDVNFILVEDLTTEILLSGVNLERDYPNVERVRTLREAFLGRINR